MMRRLLIAFVAILMLYVVACFVRYYTLPPEAQAQTNTFCASNLACTVSAAWTFTSNLSSTGGTVQLSGCQHVSTAQSFATALAAVSNPGCIIIDPGVFTVSANATVPSGVTLQFSQGGQLSIATAITLSLSSPSQIQAPDTQIFVYVGTGKASFTVAGSGGGSTMKAVWFPGATLDAQLTNAVSALGGPGIVDARSGMPTLPSFAANWTISQRDLTVLMPSAIQLSSFGIIVTAGTWNVRLLWPTPTITAAAKNSSVSTGVVVQVGSSASDTQGFEMENFSLDMSSASSGVVGIQLNRCLTYTLRKPVITGITAGANTQKLIALVGTGNSTTGEIYDPILNGGSSQIFFDNVANANSVYGGIYSSSANIAANLNFDGGAGNSDGNRVFGGDIENSPVAIRFNNATHNQVYGMRLEGNTNNVTSTVNAQTNTVLYSTGTGNIANKVSDVGASNFVGPLGARPVVSKSTAYVNLTAQSAAQSATTLLTVPGSFVDIGPGTYCVTYDAAVTTAATTSSVLGGTNGFQLVYTDNDDGVVRTTPAGPTNNSNAIAAGQVSGQVCVNAKGNTALQYQFGYTSVGATAMQYALHVRVEYVQ